MEEGEVSDLILCLKKLKESKSLLLSSISDFDLLLSSLLELNNMVEMDDVKMSIIAQVKFLLVNTVCDNEKKNFEDHMLHTVLCGSPGTGKSAIGVILSKIWLALGLLKKEPIKEQIEIRPIEIRPTEHELTSSTEEETESERISQLEKQVQNLISSGKIKNKVVKNLQNHIYNMKEKLKDINSNNRSMSYKLKTLKRNIGNIPLLNDLIADIKTLQEAIENIYTTSITDETLSFTITVNRSDTTLSPQNSGNLISKEISGNLISKGLTKGNSGGLTKGNSGGLKISGDLKKSGIFHMEPHEKRVGHHRKNEGEVENIFNDLQNMMTPKKNDIIRIVSREDFVGGFLGQTAMKTEKLLKESLGKVLFIDEAYSLINDEKDSYGKEALCVLNRFMSEHPSEIVVIFAGYKEMLDSTIFYYQPGLKRRCSWNFEIKGYTENGLAKIFESQLNENNWVLDPNLNVVEFFKDHLKDFPNYGGDTLRLAFYCKICYSSEVFDNGYANERVIDKKILNNAFEYLKNYSTKEKEEVNHHISMFM